MKRINCYHPACQYKRKDKEWQQTTKRVHSMHTLRLQYLTEDFERAISNKQLIHKGRKA